VLTHHEATNHEVREIPCSTLNTRPHHHDHTSKCDGSLATKVIRYEWCDWKRDNGADRIESGEEAKERTLWVPEVVLERVEHPQVVEHGPVIVSLLDDQFLWLHTHRNL